MTKINDNSKFYYDEISPMLPPEIQRGVQWLSKEYPNAQIVLAHCGRCYLPAEMKKAVDSVKDLSNVYMDTSMVWIR